MLGGAPEAHEVLSKTPRIEIPSTPRVCSEAFPIKASDYSLGTVEREAPVKVDVERQEGRHRGSAWLRQSEFGITPVKVAGGTIKVKDEVRLDFEVVGR